MCLLRVEHCEQYKESEPALVHEEKGQENRNIDHEGVVLVDEHEHESGADGEGQGTDGGHADKHLEDELVSAGDSVRVFESEELEGFNEERHDDGAHEEGGGAAEETGDRHDLDGRVGVEVCRPCTHVGERREEIVSTGSLFCNALLIRVLYSHFSENTFVKAIVQWDCSFRG